MVDGWVDGSVGDGVEYGANGATGWWARDLWPVGHQECLGSSCFSSGSDWLYDLFPAIVVCVDVGIGGYFWAAASTDSQRRREAFVVTNRDRLAHLDFAIYLFAISPAYRFVGLYLALVLQEFPKE